MKRDYQVTLICTNGKYRPVSAIVSVEQAEDVDLTRDKKEKAKIQLTGITKICQKRYWTKKDLVEGSYTKVKVRLYDRAKIEAENAARYEAIKEAKYASGEWKRPKGKKK